jgi:hypothetical protein
MALPEVKGLQYETNAPLTGAFPRQGEVKGLQYETNAPLTGNHPRSAKVKGIMFQFVQERSEVLAQGITVGGVEVISGEFQPKFIAKKGSTYQEKFNAKLWQNKDGVNDWQEIT